MAKHKLFISYYHSDDEYYRDKFEELFGDLFINKSVQIGDIDDDLSDEYIKRLIRENYISDTSVVVVLVGKNTYCRKHVDWEISAGLLNNAGLIGLALPSHSSYKKINIQKMMFLEGWLIILNHDMHHFMIGLRIEQLWLI